MRPSLTPDEARDFAIRLTDALVVAGYIKDCTDTDDDSEFEVQEILYAEIVRSCGAGTTP